MTVTAFFVGHGSEKIRRIRVVFIQFVRELPVNAAILFFQANREREQLLLR
jgi:hypothetical protein